MLVLKTDIVESTLRSVSTKIFLTTFNWSLFWILGGMQRSYMNAEIIYPIQVPRNHAGAHDAGLRRCFHYTR